MKWNPKYVLTIPWIGSLAIVLNVYNGDILGISCNFEYLLWYIPPLIYFMAISARHYNKVNVIHKWEKFVEFSCEIFLCILAISCNIYWHYAWIKDAKTNYRHRTEYYDTQCLLCSMLYTILYSQFHKDIEIKKGNIKTVVTTV